MFLSPSLPPKIITRQAFMKLDANGDGYLSFQEIKTGRPVPGTDAGRGTCFFRLKNRWHRMNGGNKSTVGIGGVESSIHRVLYPELVEFCPYEALVETLRKGTTCP